MNINLEYIYKILGMKEIELQATRDERDKLKSDLDAMRAHCVELQDKLDKENKE